jgi:hypothetical protein
MTRYRGWIIVGFALASWIAFLAICFGLYSAVQALAGL